MYIFKNALRAVLRNKGRNVLLGLIILVLAITCTITLAISSSADNLINSYKESSPIEATISFNRQNMMQDFGKEKGQDDLREEFANIESVTIADVENYADSDYVSSYYYSVSTNVSASDLEAISNDDAFDRGGPDRPEDTSGFTLTGYSSYEAMTDFISGKYKIIDGSISDDFSANDCIINEELATLNDLEVGDTIVLESNDETYEFIITGIYSETDSENMNLFSNSSNTIITSADAVARLQAENEDLVLQVNPTFILTDEDVFESFSSEVSDKGLDSNYQVTTNIESIENSLMSISNVKTFANTFLIITFIIGVIILLVINHINIRERKYEIGVLRTIGMKKSKVCLQFMIELLIVTFVALIIGLGIGSVLTKPISNMLLENEIQNSQRQNEQINENFGRGGHMDNALSEITSLDIQMPDSLEATVSIEVLVKLLIAGLLLSVISSVSAIVAINRFTPLTILKERS